MTIQEAYKILCNGLLKAPSDHDWATAFKMAINSLEAWDSLIKEMEKEIYSYDAFPDIWYGISESFDIIKKHLKEVEE